MEFWSEIYKISIFTIETNQGFSFEIHRKWRVWLKTKGISFFKINACSRPEFYKAQSVRSMPQGTFLKLRVTGSIASWHKDKTLSNAKY